MSEAEPIVVELSAVDTHPLRRTELRTGTISDVVTFEGDESDTTLHLGVRLGADGPIVAVSTWLERAWPGEPALPAYQVRGMATAPDRRRAGIGALVLHAGLERCGARGAALVWARARMSAIGFYTRYGFEPAGEEYLDGTTGLPHRDIVRRIR